MARTCTYCKSEAEIGWIETGNNGPIVSCPICNPNGEREREYEMALLQREAKNFDAKKWGDV
jgi:hypothetical protein